MNKPDNIIVETVAGSHLFGLNTPDSDYDRKGIFSASLEQIVMNTAKRSILYSTNSGSTKNTHYDEDFEFKELRTFVNDCLKGQTYAVEMLYCPENKIVSTSRTWQAIQNNRTRFRPNDLSPFVGYALSQAKKYSLRGERLAKLQEVVDIFSSYDPKTKLGDIIENIPLNDLVYTDQYAHPSGITEQRLVVVGCILQQNQMLSECLVPLRKRIETYGTRSKETQISGADWKAISHAFRLMFEWEQLLTDGFLTFPVPHRDFIMQVKLGSLPFEQVQDRLSQEYDRIHAIPNKLPAPDYQFAHEFIIGHYLPQHRTVYEI